MCASSAIAVLREQWLLSVDMPTAGIAQRVRAYLFLLAMIGGIAYLFLPWIMRMRGRNGLIPLDDPPIALSGNELPQNATSVGL